jgi:hypothetical protein
MIVVVVHEITANVFGTPQGTRFCFCAILDIK